MAHRMNMTCLWGAFAKLASLFHIPADMTGWPPDV
jgi:hypothetical protein